ncbi:MAG: glycosyltransferase [Bacteroidota bacterium]|nr:glycosyltransferase [Bacteroidota bacterium]
MKKRILFLADIDSAHTRKWAISLSERGYEIGIFSLRKSESSWFKDFPAIHVFNEDGFATEKFHVASALKLSYLQFVPALKATIKTFQPGIVHAHYATSYGLLGVRSGFHPLIISVWGSDIFEFPKKSILHRLLVFNNLKKADAIFSTSEIMKKEVQHYVNHDVAVTPFGVDINEFSPQQTDSLFSGNPKVIGTIKSLENNYGIDVLIKAFALVKKQYPPDLKLLICGDGTKEQELKKLAEETGYGTDILFAGRINQQEVARYHNMIDVFVNVSLQESFGVAVVEAMACEKPVVVTSVGGLKEVVEENVSGVFVLPANVEKTAEGIFGLLNDPEKAKRMGKAGRNNVLKKYDWKKNLDEIEKLYAGLLSR